MILRALRGRPLQLLLLLLAFGLDQAAAQRAQFGGVATVIDGDTLDVGGVRVRLWGIDAPESRQVCTLAGQDYACGGQSTNHLRALVGNHAVTCEARDTDRYGRTVALCRAGGIDLSAAMVRDGWAVAFVRYSTDYVAEEQDARAHRRGLWQGVFTPPDVWRKQRG